MKNIRARRLGLTCMTTNALQEWACTGKIDKVTPGVCGYHCHAHCTGASRLCIIIPLHTPLSPALLRLLLSPTLQPGGEVLVQCVNISVQYAFWHTLLCNVPAMSHSADCDEYRGIPRSVSTSARRTRPLKAAKWA